MIVFVFNKTRQKCLSVRRWFGGFRARPRLASPGLLLWLPVTCSSAVASEDLGATMKTDSGNGDSFLELELHTIQHNGRNVTFSKSPDNGSPPVLFFYPVGAGRRMLLSFQELFSNLWFICINRPGKGGTSPPDSNVSHLETTIQDILVVLDKLGIQQVSLLCMCAGTPFCFAFAARHPERTTGRLIGISTWVQPADCDYNNTKLLYHVGTKQPNLAGLLTGTLMSSMGCMFSSFPTSWFTSFLRKALSIDECQAFDEKYSKDEFCDMLKWMQQDPRGGVSGDLQVLLSRNIVDYEALSKSQDSLILWHGTNDNTVPYVGVEWLAKQLPDAELNTIRDGTHEGCMFLLHSSIVDSLKSLGKVADVTSKH